MINYYQMSTSDQGKDTPDVSTEFGELALDAMSTMWSNIDIARQVIGDSMQTLRTAFCHVAVQWGDSFARNWFVAIIRANGYHPKTRRIYDDRYSNIYRAIPFDDKYFLFVETSRPVATAISQWCAVSFASTIDCTSMYTHPSHLICSFDDFDAYMKSARAENQKIPCRQFGSVLLKHFDAIEELSRIFAPFCLCNGSLRLDDDIPEPSIIALIRDINERFWQWYLTRNSDYTIFLDIHYGMVRIAQKNTRTQYGRKITIQRAIVRHGIARVIKKANLCALGFPIFYLNETSFQRETMDALHRELH